MFLKYLFIGFWIVIIRSYLIDALLNVENYIVIFLKQQIVQIK